MGINGLLPLLKPATNKTHISALRGKRVAIDGYSWLHKGAYCCSRELCMDEPTDRFVHYFMQRLQTVINCGLVPTVVFDGANLPMKKMEEDTRRIARKQNLERALAQMRDGNTAAAEECFQRAVNIKPCHAKQVVDALKRKGIKYVVAPYEADPQLAFLAKNGLVDVILTEDSDMLAYGCPHVLFKMDKNGYAEEIRADDIYKLGLFVGFNAQMFLEMCVLSGCDFLPKIEGIGIKKAHDHVKRLKTYPNFIRRLRYSGFNVPKNYEEDFGRALMVFRHQTVWDPEGTRLVHLEPVPQDFSNCPEDLAFLGPHYDNRTARRVVTAEVDPSTFARFASHQEADARTQMSTMDQGVLTNSSFRLSNLSVTPGAEASCASQESKPRSVDGIASLFTSRKVAMCYGGDNGRRGANQGFKVPRNTGRAMGSGKMTVAMGRASKAPPTNVLRLSNHFNRISSPPKERVTSKFFARKPSAAVPQAEPAKAAAAQRKEEFLSPKDRDAYLQSCTTEAKRVVREITVNNLASFAFQQSSDLSSDPSIAEERQQQELVSPPRKMHRMMKHADDCCKPFKSHQKPGHAQLSKKKSTQAALDFSRYLCSKKVGLRFPM